MAAKWIWRGSDFELYFYNLMTKKRRERDVIIYPIWTMDRPEYQALFSASYEAEKDSEFSVEHTGDIAVNVNGGSWFSRPKDGKYFLPAGKGVINIYCFDEKTFPTIFIDSEYVRTGEGWHVLQCGNEWKSVSCSDKFDTAQKSPLCFGFDRVKIKPANVTEVNGGVLFDMGRELVGTPQILCGKKDDVRVCYGESSEEALDTENSEVVSVLACDGKTYAHPAESKGFRFAFVDAAKQEITDFYVDEEKYIPPFEPYFITDDPEINRIYDVAKYTLELTSREFFIDGIKRDRWVWAGDALQSELFDLYSFNDKEIIKRTIRALIGTRLINNNINTILDYNFYFVLSVYYYYYFTGDAPFVKEIYPRLVSLMEFIFKKPHTDGLLQAKNEWIFIDWADIPRFAEINNSCPICLIQILYWASLKAMAKFAEIAEDRSRAEGYFSRAAAIKEKTIKTYFNGNAGFYHDIFGKLLTKYGNMAAVLLDFADEIQTETIKRADGSAFAEITTPYMKFYESCMLAKNGETGKVLDYMKTYWGGMLKEGATSFWEKYNPSEKGAEKYAMYGRKYGKSLCHSWGAGPIYLLGRYVAGLYPYETGYKRYALNPYLKGLKFKAELPVNDGTVRVEYDGKYLTVYSRDKDGVLMGKGYAGEGISYDDAIQGCSLKRGVEYKIKIKE